MSKKTTNIKFSLFMSDPISSKNNKKSSHNKNTDLFIKGKKDYTFELKKGHSNVYVITESDGTKLEFDRDSLLETLKSLKKYSHTPIKALDDDQQDSFTKVMDALKKLYKVVKLYELIHNDVKEIFNDVKVVIPGTIAAYFIGCSSNDNFSGPMGCNPRCAASLAVAGKNPDDYTCNDLVLMYENDKTFSSLNTKISQHTYIYIGDVNFKGFTKDNIKQLVDANIISTTLVYSKADGSYRDPVKPMLVTELPIISETQTIDDNGSDNGAWLLFILIAIAIIILLVILYLSYSKV